jgi:small subunit ribosomal protein S13
MANPEQPVKPAAPVAARPGLAVPEMRHLVRILNTDLDGKKTISFALAKIKGVGISFAHAACRVAKVNVAKKSGALTAEEIKKLEEVIREPVKAGIPAWMVNRRYDVETGADKHLLAGDLQFTIENDIKMMKKMKSYKGVRHSLGQPVRGQRTRSNFRKNKGKVMGVRRAASAKPAVAAGGKS